MKRILLFSLTFMLATIGFKVVAQEDITASEDSSKLEFNVSVDLQSRYVWRGQPLGGNAPAIEPTMSLSYDGLTFGCWGAYSLSSEPYAEFDWFLSYSFWQDYITLMVTDYSFPRFENDYHYFDYRKDHTEHVLEGGLLFNVPKTDLTLSVYTNFYGADARTADNKMVYSTYCEASYLLSAEKIGTDFDFACGFAVNGKENGFYGNDGFAVVNVAVGATKSIQIKKFSLPLYARVIANPCANKLFFVCGTQIAF